MIEKFEKVKNSKPVKAIRIFGVCITGVTIYHWLCDKVSEETDKIINS